MDNRDKNAAKSNIKTNIGPEMTQKTEVNQQEKEKFHPNKLLKNLQNGFWSEITT